jgi:anthranilate phosphoribosyltransferase
MLLGVASEELGEKIAAVLNRLGTKHSLVVHSRDGLDEISVSGLSIVWEAGEGIEPLSYEISPENFGFYEGNPAEIKGGTPQENAGMLRRVFEGERGTLRDAVVINTAAALFAADLVSDLKSGVRLAEESIDSGEAMQKLAKLVKLSQNLV